MILQTQRLILRPWAQSDAESLFSYASDPDIGPRAGWPPHKNTEESLEIIRKVLSVPECYAITEKGTDRAIGGIQLRQCDLKDPEAPSDHWELGFWLAKPFWGRGYMPEAAEGLLRHGFANLGIHTVWCSYYEGNAQSRRVQEKLGFVYHHSCEAFPVSLLKTVRVRHTNRLTREEWVLQNPSQ